MTSSVAQSMLDQDGYFQPEDITTRITDQQLMIVYNMVEYRELDIVEINDYCRDQKLLTDFQRTPGSMWFAMVRMHVAIHGILPYNLPDSPGWFTVPKTMIDFCKRFNIDVDSNINSAKVEASTRPKKIKREAAIKQMSNYYQKNKHWLPDNISKHREQIIERIMKGMDAEQAFQI